MHLRTFINVNVADALCMAHDWYTGILLTQI
jgi:hypothetical protein